MDFKEHKVRKIKLSPDVAEHKIKLWCAYQERSQHDTRQKLYGFGLFEEEVEGIIGRLVEENYVNEERFAKAFAGGKFRIKHWGKIKIRIELRKHKVSDYCLKKALDSITDEAYKEVMEKVIEKKLKSTKSKEQTKKYYSTLSYLVSRGFEADLVKEKLNILIKLP